MITTGIVVKTVGSAIYDYAVSINDIGYLVKNAEDVVINSGDPVVVRYEPQDQFCEVIPLEVVQKALSTKEA